MMQVWIILSVISNSWCVRYSDGGIARFTEYKDNHADSSCEWNDPPENGHNFMLCSRGECEVPPGIYSIDGTIRKTRCDPHYTLVLGYERDVCHNGEWSSSGHECVQCGKSPKTFDGVDRSALIIGGSYSFEGDFPWMAALFMSINGDPWTLKCGGTLISPYIVLTAAHCLDINGRRRLKREELKVGLARLSLDYSITDPDSIISTVKEIFIPEKYVGQNRHYDVDIGLVVLEERVPINDLIMPACLDWSGNMIPNHNEKGVLAGWGVTENSTQSKNLKWTYQKYINYQQCRGMLSTSDYEFLSPDKFCADKVKGGMADQGDSGGGLTFVRNGIHYVYGIVSTKLLSDFNQLRFFTSVTNEMHRTWLSEKWRELQAQPHSARKSSSSSSRKECTEDAQCSDNRRCVRQTCLDLCPSACGTNSVCRMANHLPVCLCKPGHIGNPYDTCTKEENADFPESTARKASSSSSRKECTEDAQCPDNKRCVRQTCLDLCPSACGTNSVCRMVNHLPVCTCSPGQKGDPYVSCEKEDNTDLPVLTGCKWLMQSNDSEVPSAVESCALNENHQPEPLKRNEYPYLGIITDENFNHVHYGALISEQWFLSTVSGFPAFSVSKKVKLGINNGPEVVYNSSRMPDYDVIEEHVHPDYESSSINNIGLFKLDRAVRISDSIHPACVDPEYQLERTTGVVIGEINNKLMKSTTDIILTNQCRRNTANFKDESMFCVNNFRTNTGFQMYGGFPMVGPMDKSYCRYGLLGLAAFGEIDHPKGFMRLSHYLPWIENTIQPQTSFRSIEEEEDNFYFPKPKVSGCKWLLQSDDSEVPSAVESCSLNENQRQPVTLINNEYPYLGIIGDTRFKNIRYGVLISEQWFLSTVTGYPEVGSRKKVKLGISNGPKVIFNSSRMPDYDVIEENIHPDYENSTINNIGLYKLDRVVRISDSIHPACLDPEYQLEGTTGVVIGEINNTLMKSTTDIISTHQCRRNTVNFKDESMFCVNIDRSNTGFKMYGGFPMVGPMDKSYCRYGLLGLAAFGRIGQPKGYMRLSHYLSWIENIIRPQS